VGRNQERVLTKPEPGLSFSDPDTRTVEGGRLSSSQKL
jgi:hypothetical protein